MGTCVHVKGADKHCNILFDCGHLEQDEYSARHVFVSHGHVDHIGLCVSHARGRKLSGGQATYYVPPHCVEPLLAARKSFEVLDESSIPMNIVAVNPYDVIDISPSYKVNQFCRLLIFPNTLTVLFECRFLHFQPSTAFQVKVSMLHLTYISLCCF